jgi:hypothetical protein
MITDPIFRVLRLHVGAVGVDTHLAHFRRLGVDVIKLFFVFSESVA